MSDRAALIAELRDVVDFLSDGTGEHPAPDRSLEEIVEDVAKALASAPSQTGSDLQALREREITDEMTAHGGDAIYAFARSGQPGGGFGCPPSWTPHWRDWYRLIARIALKAALGARDGA